MPEWMRELLPKDREPTEAEVKAAIYKLYAEALKADAVKWAKEQ